MPDGTLGSKVLDKDGKFTGKYEGNSIPGAEDEDEAWDTRYLKVRCAPGSYSRRGPGGIATYFEPDTKTAKEKTEYGEAKVDTDDGKICVILPRTKIVTVEGKKVFYNWFDVCCTLVFSDCVTELEFVKEEAATDERRTPLEPLVSCHTDFGEFLLDLLKQLVGKGVSELELKKLLQKFLPMLLGGAAKSPETTTLATFEERERRPELQGRIAAECVTNRAAGHQP